MLRARALGERLSVQSLRRQSQMYARNRHSQVYTYSFFLTLSGYQNKVQPHRKASDPRLPATGNAKNYHVIQKKAGLFCRTRSSVRLWWELKEPKGPVARERSAESAVDPRIRQWTTLLSRRPVLRLRETPHWELHRPDMSITEAGSV